MTDRFEAEKGAVADVARAFGTEADQLEASLGRFESAAYSVHDAFGPWGVSHEMLQEYLDTAYEALKGLHSVCAALQKDAERLTRVEANYADAEAASMFEGT